MAPIPSSAMATPYSGIIQKHIDHEDGGYYESSYGEEPVFGLSSIVGAEMFRVKRGGHNMDGHSEKEEDKVNNAVENTIGASATTPNNNNVTTIAGEDIRSYHHVVKSTRQIHYRLSGVARLLLILILTMVSKFTYKHIIQKNIPRLLKLKFPSKSKSSDKGGGDGEEGDGEKDENAPPPIYPEFVFDHPYVTSSYYISTSNTKILEKMYDMQVLPKKDRLPDRERGIVSRLAILRPFCEVSL